jgi:hypothetical protein
VRLPGTQNWPDADIDAALAFADNLSVATTSIGRVLAERRLAGDAPWQLQSRPSDILYALGEAAALALTTGRFSHGLRIAGSLLATIKGPAPKLTMMQRIFGATLGAVAGTVEVRFVGDGLVMALYEGERHLLVALTEHPVVERQRLADLVVPAAFASRRRLSKRYMETGDGFTMDQRSSWQEGSDPHVSFNEFVRVWEQQGEMTQLLLVGRLLEFESYVRALQSDAAGWARMEFRGPLIDWPLLAMLVGMHRVTARSAEEVVVAGPATRFLHDLARAIASETPYGFDAAE